MFLSQIYTEYSAETVLPALVPIVGLELLDKVGFFGIFPFGPGFELNFCFSSLGDFEDEIVVKLIPFQIGNNGLPDGALH